MLSINGFIAPKNAQVSLRYQDHAARFLFYIICRVFLHENVPRGQTVDTELYVGVLKHVHERVRRAATQIVS